MDMNEFARQVTLLEGGKKNLDIAQVKEVIKHTRNIVRQKTGIDIYHVIKTIDFQYVEKPVVKASRGRKKKAVVTSEAESAQ